ANRAEARGDALQARGRNLPIGVAAGAAEQVELPRHALDERGLQLRHQLRIAADGGGERGVQDSGIKGHPQPIRPMELTRRFISGPFWYKAATCEAWQ